jgi:hypothetical protein
MTVSNLYPAAAALLVAIAAAAAPASAQGTAAGKWEIEAHGGFASATVPDGGSAAALPPATPFTTLGQSQSRRVSSWFFGDGTSLLNTVNATLSPGSRLTAIDPVITASAASRDSGANFGVRVARRIGSRYFAEAAVDVANTPLQFSQRALDGMQASSSTFITAFRGLFISGPSPNPNVTAPIATSGGSGREIVTTGVFGVDLLTRGSLIPYVVGGAGVAHSTGGQPSATITGNYTFSIPFPGVPPLNETDRLTIRVVREANAAVGVFGGGVRYVASPRWGVRLDVRASVGGGSTDVVIDAAPSVATGTPGIILITPTTPSAVFSTSSGVTSSLSGPAISGLKTFTGSGSSVRTNVTAGVYLRF